jgi:3-hydroxyisobutyryl-CoA hydrolase
MICGAGSKAFCAGGDVKSLAEQILEDGPEGQQASIDYFALEYQLDHLIATYSKPYIAVMDGITMGGGVGLSVHAPFRIATERTVFAMPETTIGFFPDVGGSFFLSRLDGEIGTYLGLTSERLTGVQTLYAGIATHYLHSSVLSNLTARLSELVFRDYATLPQRLELVNNTMAEFSTGLPSAEQEPVLLAGNLRRAIDRCFKHNTVEDIFKALEQETENKGWAQKTLETLSQRSPTALKVTLRQLRVGKNWSIAEAFQREHQMAAHFTRHPDFTEGVKARLISKPPTLPKWQPETLEAVSDEAVDAFFTIPPSKTRLPLLSKGNYSEYPHAHFTLPGEKEIERFVRDRSSSRKQIVEEFGKKWGQKEGVREKVAEVLARRTVKTPQGLRWAEEV